MKRSPRSLVFGIVIAGVVGAMAQGGSWVDQRVHSPGLEANLIGTRPDPLVRVYLPPGYDAEPERRYPVLYLLHGITNTASSMGYIKGQADELLAAGEIEPLIIVTATAWNRYGGGLYSNSTTIGRWEDTYTHDLIDYVDGTFRTLARRESRGIAGWSMGGYGAVKLAMRHPDLYGAAYGVNSCCLSFEAMFMELYRQALIDADRLTSAFGFDSNSFDVRLAIAAAAAFAANSEAEPFYADFPLTQDGTLIEDVWERWLEHDPVTMLPARAAGLQRVHLAFDAGDVDDEVTGSEEFAQALKAAGVPHRFQIYPGDHSSGVRERMRTHVLPFMDENLSSSLPSAVAEVTWAGVKQSIP